VEIWDYGVLRRPETHLREIWHGFSPMPSASRR
jgi:hypothetical protein